MWKLTEKQKEWINDLWPGYHDNCHDEDLMAFFNNRIELDRLNSHRNENTKMFLFNRMIIKALYERNRDLFEDEDND